VVERVSTIVNSKIDSFFNYNLMKNNTRNISLILVFLFLSILEVKSQSFQSQSQIIKECGPNFTSGKTPDGTKYLEYVTPSRSEASGSFDTVKRFYFTILSNGEEGCYMWKIIVPSSEVNNWVSVLKNKYVEIRNMVWKDYESNMLYNVIVLGPYCTIQSHYDKI
jgi:hypothetical protein